MFRRFTSERVRHQRRKRFAVFAVIYILLGFSIFLFAWQLSYASFLRIQSVFIEGEKTISHNDVFDVVQNNITGAYGHVFSKRNIFLYPRQKIQQDIRATFPSVKKVTLNSVGMHALTVRLEERKAHIVACSLVENVTETASRECYFLDDTAFAFILAPHFSGSSYITYELKMAERPLGTFIFSSEEFEQLNRFIASLKGLSFRVTTIRIEEGEMEVYVGTPGRGELLLLVKRNAVYEEVVRNLETIMQSDDFKKAGGLAGVEYIDLRFGNKVFYKEKEHLENIEPPSTFSSELKPLE